MKLDVIIPSYNEDGNIEIIHKELTKVLKDIKYTLIFVDDGSTDHTLAKLKDIYNKDKRHVRVLSFSRNFGKDAAIYAGMSVSNAEYTVVIDADMQQNPKYIIEMLEYIEKHPEYDQIAMVNNYENEKGSKRFLKRIFYKILNRLSEQKFVAGASDFRLFKKNVVKALVKIGEKNRFSKGLFAWVGFNTYYMSYEIDERYSGESKFKFRKQLSYALDGIVSFSTKPLKLATIIGSIISLIAFIYIIEILLETIIFGKDIPGYASIMCVVLLLGGIQLLVLGIIGEYIAKSYIEAKDRPVYVTKEVIGYDDDIL